MSTVFANLLLQVKNKSSKPKKTAPVQNQVSSSDYVADDDDELMQVISIAYHYFGYS